MAGASGSWKELGDEATAVSGTALGRGLYPENHREPHKGIKLGRQRSALERHLCLLRGG